MWSNRPQSAAAMAKAAAIVVRFTIDRPNGSDVQNMQFSRKARVCVKLQLASALQRWQKRHRRAPSTLQQQLLTSPK
jgi:hypothetical protein